MAEIFIFKTFQRKVEELTQEEKWNLVKAHYVKSYPEQAKHFERPLSKEAIDQLYKNMMLLQESEKQYMRNASHRQIEKFQKLSAPKSS